MAVIKSTVGIGKILGMPRLNSLVDGITLPLTI